MVRGGSHRHAIPSQFIACSIVPAKPVITPLQF
jgi:hypothetical protein